MIRKIIFRGINQDKKFIYGDLVQDSQNKRYAIIPQIAKEHDYNAFEVLGISIGQNTGLKDKNGQDIYEGDVLEFPFEMGIAYVINDGFRFAIKSFGSQTIEYESEEVLKQTKIIGNIYENPQFTQSSE